MCIGSVAELEKYAGREIKAGLRLFLGVLRIMRAAIHLSIYLSTYLSMYLSIYIYIYKISIHMGVYGSRVQG